MAVRPDRARPGEPGAAAVYARVSTEEQAERGYSLPAQVEACRRRAAEIGAGAVAAFIDEGYSGSSLDRPGLTRLRAAVRAGAVRLLVVLDPDRLSRNLIHLLLLTDEFQRSGCQVVFVNMAWEDTPEGRLFLSIRGAVAEFERAKIAERTMRGKRQKAEGGGIACAPVWLYGYRYDPATDTLAVVEEEARAVRRIFELCVRNGWGAHRIARAMGDEGWPAPRGRRWHASTVGAILSNPAYDGRLRQFQGDRTLFVAIPPILAPGVFAAAEEVRRDHARRGGTAAALLSGIGVCGSCGGRLAVRTAVRRHGERRYRYRYYRCHGSRCAGPRHHRVEAVDAAVWRELERLLVPPEAGAAQLQAPEPPRLGAAGRRRVAALLLERAVVGPGGRIVLTGRR